MSTGGASAAAPPFDPCGLCRGGILRRIWSEFCATFRPPPKKHQTPVMVFARCSFPPSRNGRVATAPNQLASSTHPFPRPRSLAGRAGCYPHQALSLSLSSTLGREACVCTRNSGDPGRKKDQGGLEGPGKARGAGSGGTLCKSQIRSDQLIHHTPRSASGIYPPAG